VQIPAKGGAVVEGIVGTPRFLNPVLAITDADRDINNLVYSGLLKFDEGGNLVSDLADSYKISEDGTVYTFFLKPNIYFHDGKKVTSEDVEFTISKIKDPNIKSPKRSSWENVTVEKIDEETIKFTLKKPYSPFIQNATVGILPKHIWKNVSDDSFLFSNFNLKPIGSGPYKMESLTEDESGLPIEYKLRSFKKYISGEPFIEKITLKFYPNEDKLIEAYSGGEVKNINSISPKNIKKIGLENSNLKIQTLPRIFGVFFNQSNQPIFLHDEVRKALDIATPRQNIIDEVLLGYGKSIDGPLPNDYLEEEKYSIEKARELLENKGWKQNEFGIYEKKNEKGVVEKLSFNISTGDIPELKNTATILQSSWQKIGANVEVKIFETGDLNQNVIRPRKYESLLFGEIIGKDLDLFPFWHSSERNDPGLNIAMYTNAKVDKLLEDIRKTTDKNEVDKLLNLFEEEVKKDTPAIFIYSPEFIYINNKDIKNVILTKTTIPADRFQNVNKWYIETNKIWKIFNKDNN
jgi:peptide/nickel transport system substrate-binding protein